MQTEPIRAEALLSSAAGWLAHFEQYDVKYLALDPDEDRGLIQLLQARPEWTLDFWDRQGVLFVRSDVLQGQCPLAPSVRIKYNERVHDTFDAPLHAVRSPMPT
jgi:hypothetical protein